MRFLDSIEHKHPDYIKFRYRNELISLSDVQDALLSPNQALVEYFVGDSSIFTFTILKDTFHVHQIKKDFPLEEWVADLRCGIFSAYTPGTGNCSSKTESEARRHFSMSSYKLYGKVFAHIDAIIPNGADIIVVPDGALGYVPFDVLLVEEPKENLSVGEYHYLLKDHVISYAYSATLQHEMQYRKHRKKPKKTLLAFAPEFSQTVDTTFLTSRFLDISDHRNWCGPLKFNIPEVHAIDSIVGADLYIGPDATEDRFKNLAGDYRILHLSTHGKANDKVGDYSFLAFHHLNDSLENEWLYNRELYNLDLNADMVVLSACETGIGELQRGEGIISLARGFSYAGAKSIVTSLWNVNDQSTKLLMEFFYQNLKDGMSKDKALRKAKLDYLAMPPNLGHDPYYWAAFIPIGDMSPIEWSNGMNWMWSVAIGGVLLGLWFWWRYSSASKRASQGT